MDLTVQSESFLRELRDRLQRMGEPVDDIDNEIARRQSQRTMRAAQPLLDQSKIGIATGNAAWQQARAQKSAADASLAGTKATVAQRLATLPASDPASEEARRAALGKNADASLIRAKAYEKATDNQNARSMERIQIAQEVENNRRDKDLWDRQYKNQRLTFDKVKQKIATAISLSGASARTASSVGRYVQNLKADLSLTLQKLDATVTPDPKERERIQAEYNAKNEQVKEAENWLKEVESYISEASTAANELDALTQPATQPMPQPLPQQPAPTTQQAQPASQPAVTFGVLKQKRLREQAAKARAGDPAAQERIRRIRQAAADGDIEAQEAVAIIGE